MRSEECFHLGGLYAVTPDLDLEIAPPKVQQTAIGQQSALVAGAEHAPFAAIRVRQNAASVNSGWPQ